MLVAGRLAPAVARRSAAEQELAAMPAAAPAAAAERSALRLGARSRWRQRRAVLLRGIRCGVFALFILFGSMICLLWHYCHLAQSDRCLKLHLFYCKCFKHVCLTITKTMPSRKEELMEYPRVLLELSPKAQQPHICQTAFTGSFRT